MDPTERYLQNLKSGDPATRADATKALWAFWHRQAGAEMERELDDATKLMNPHQLNDALISLKSLVEKCPEFPEAHNKLATVLFLMCHYEASVAECEEVLRRVPHHFGALNGMGMCLFELKRFEQAIRSFQKALEIQPYAQINHMFIARCRAGLN
jgi:tetratricopeptide (TPR) repeat protein